VRGWVGRVGPFTSASLAARIGLEDGAVAYALARLESEGLVLRGGFLPDVPRTPERPHWCERSVLARIHRRTLGRLRREIEPVTAADFLRFLARWSHLAPGARLHGARGLEEVLLALQGFHAAAGAWERELLPARVAGYTPALLDELCLAGEIVWGRLGVAAEGDDDGRRRAPTRSAPITLARREDVPWLLAGEPPPVGPAAAAIVAILERRGACFLAELASAAGAAAPEVEAALWELVSAGIVTCDGFAGLRMLIEHEARRGARRPGAIGGRWSLLRPPQAAPSCAVRDRDARLERLGDQYLRRYGVVFRDLLAREYAPPWRELLRVYRAQEARGAIRGGRFVQGFSGEQFALPDAVDALRAMRRSPRDGAERIEVAGPDPLNLAGILTPGPRVPAVLGQRGILGGALAAAARAAGSRDAHTA
jgi:ATP-dependent Lhr-like helicase